MSQKHETLMEEEFELILEKESQLFEDTLNSKNAPQDPRERIRLRHLHYQKQYEKRLERMRTMGTLAKKKEREGVSGSTLSRIRKKCNIDFLNRREFDAHGTDKIYRGPLITSSDSEYLIREQSNMIEFLEKQDNVKKIVRQVDSTETRNATVLKQQYAVFLGEDGTLYDKNYMPIIRQDAEHLPSRGKLSDVQKEALLQEKEDLSLQQKRAEGEDERHRYLADYEFCYDPDLYQSIPYPQSFETFDEYEHALNVWAKDVKDRLGYLQLPIVMGRHYFRPSVSLLDKDDEPVAAVAKKEMNSPNSSLLDHSSTFNLLDSEETWESGLVPLEPKPEFFDTFEEFEKAMIRWCIVSLGIAQLPPHPAQFQKLLGLRIVDPPSFPIADVEVDMLTKKSEYGSAQDTYKTNKGKKGAKVKRRGRRPSDIYHVYRDNQDHLLYKGSNEWNKLKEKDKLQIMTSFKKILEIRNENKAKFKAYYIELIPRIHGIFAGDASEYKLMRRLSLSNPQLFEKRQNKTKDAVRNWIITQRQKRSLSTFLSQSVASYAITEGLKHQIPLRREDLTEEQLRQAHDCNSKEQGKTVTFKIPEFDIGQIDFEQLHKSSYIMFLQNLLKRIDNYTRYAHLNSWYYPTIPKERSEQHIAELAKLFDKIQHPNQVDSNIFLALFKSETYLDTFVEFMDRFMKQKCFIKGNKEISVFHELLHHGTSFECLRDIVTLFRLSNSRLIHAKVAFYVTSFLKTEKCKEIISRIVKERDLETLYGVAISTVFYDEVPIQLFQYTREMQELIKNKYGSDMNDFVSCLAMTYYLDCICVSLWEEDSKYPHSYPTFIQHIEVNVLLIATYLKNNPHFLSSNIWSIVGSRSKKICALGVFIVNFLFFLNCSNEIQEKMKSNHTNAVENTRRLARSKLEHVQIAASKIFTTLEEDQWRGLLTKTYSKTHNIVSDLISSCNKTVLGSQPPLISSMLYKFLEDSLTITGDGCSEEEKDTNDENLKREEENNQMIQSLLDSNAFHTILSEVLSASRERRLHQGITMGAMFLAKFAKYVVCKQMIVGEDEKKKATKSGLLSKFGAGRKKKEAQAETTSSEKASKLIINSCDINQMIEFVFNENTKLRKTYPPRMYMLDTLRHVLKCPTVFELLNLDKTLLTRILEICEDEFDIGLNRSAWRLFYQMIRFHNGTIEKIIKDNMMTNFLELIGSKIDKSSIISKNSIHYFTKIFKLPENTTPVHYSKREYIFHVEFKKESPARIGYNVPAPTVVEKYANSVKNLTEHIITKQSYTVFHFVYTKLIRNYQGWAFQSMVQLYHTLDKHSSCAKIAQKLRMQKDYKDGLDLINDMILGKKE